MDWLEQNVDAYRVISEILDELRVAMREDLEKAHGQEWYRAGLPSGIFERLISNKEGATAIDWYETEYQEILDFAVFPDFLEILESNREVFPALFELVPSPALFQVRFLELESLRSKVGRARPINEAELSFLMTFQKRLRKQLDIHRANQAVKPTPAPAETPESPEAPARPKPTAPPSPTAHVSATVPKPPPEAPKPDPEPTESGPGKTTAPATETPAADAPMSLPQMIAAGESTAILRELFREVTSLAESLWSSDIPPAPAVWRLVSKSPWYEEQFSTLGLKPLSDFYDVIAQVEKRLENGLAKHDLQRMLEDANFAHILLSLRDMFQKNRI